MKLQDKLDNIREGFERQAPEESLTIMHNATAALERSGLADRSIHIGEVMPDFNLIDTEDNFVSLSDLLENGPLVINFFRGFW
ncbi:hypothetical protein [Rubritalea tangerina]|uniref:Alkyl hydroperoxide reductase subunit C/ Thiol specific antioxidant domain-containing protein n=1 Tax=Rubritalea tangerina TaxID=430798 RepID=A0ABW4ZF80_9BACT